MGKFWNETDIIYLKENYEKENVDVLVQKLNRSEKSITQKAFKLNLKRSEEHRKNNLIKQNKLKGRDLSYGVLKGISDKYVTHSEFIKNDYSAYLTIKKYGYLELFDNLLYSSVSLPQLILKNLMDNLLDDKCRYNDRTAIKPYELDLYYKNFNLAFEYNGSYWHLNNDNDEIKKNLCLEKNITLIIIEENSRDYVNDIKTQIINNLIIINNATNKNITKENVNNIDINIDKLDVFGKNSKEFFNSYSTLKDFKKENYSLYRKMKKYKLLEKYLNHLL
jgi:hypothetical protein